MDNEVLPSICNGLGYRREDDDGTLLGYVKGEYCLDNLKDLQRFLRRDDPQGREVFKQICKWNVVSRDLIPIMENYQNDRNLVINCVKVLVFLTMPIDPASDDIAQQIEYLWHIKAAVTRHITIAVVVSLLEDPLEHLERNAFTEDDWKLVQLVLTLFRNILAIQDILLQHKASGSSAHFLHLRERFLELLFEENVMDLILVLTQHLDGSCNYLCQDNLLLLEVFHYIFQGQDPELVAKTSRGVSETDGGIETSLNTLKSIMEKEQEKRRLTKLRNSTFNSQFSGAFTRLTMDGSRTLFKGNPTVASGNNLLKAAKVQRGPLKRIAWDHGSLPATRNNILSLLCSFLEQFLSGAYNVLMQSIREDIEQEHHDIQTSDIIIFYQVACFVTSFQHHRLSISKPEITIAPGASSLHKLNDSSTFNGDICGPVAETMNEAMFSLVIAKWRYAFDTLKETNDYKFLSSAASLLKSMICMLDLVLKLSPEDSNEHQTARILLYKLFYDQTDQGMTYLLLNVVRCFDTHKQPKSDLADLVETLHTVFQLMENLQQRGTLRVSRKTRKGRKRKILGEEHSIEPEKPSQEFDNAENAADLHDKNGMPSSESNPNSIRKEGNTVPPSSGDLGIHLPDGDNLADDSTDIGDQNVNNGLIGHPYGNEDSLDDEHHPATNEVDLRVSNVLINFANNAAIYKLCWLLKFYRSNSASVNNYIINILQRISDDLELSPMLYQLSLLTIFYDILVDQKSSKCHEYRSIVDFLTKLVRRMLKKLKNQPLLFVELLLWKTRKECHHINAESLLQKVHDLRREIRSSDGGEVGSTGVAFQKSIADSLGEDEADLLVPHNLSYRNYESSEENPQGNGTENERRSSVLTPNLVVNGNAKYLDNQSEGSPSTDHSKRASARQKRFNFDQEQETTIRNLYEKYKDDRHCNRLIAEALDLHGKVSPVQISCKLKQLGLSVASRKRRFPVHKSSNIGEDEASTKTSSPNGLMGLEDTSIHVRKRIRAFSKEQELMVRSLYEKFKDHKRCTHMIANALDADNTYTAAQISRKLKQLGLHVPRERRSHKGSKYSGDVDVSEKEEQSDDETLVTLLERSKGRKGTSMSKLEAVQEGGSDDELLGTMLRSKRKRGMSENVKSELQQAEPLRGGFDDEHLSTMLIRDVHTKSTPLSTSGGTAVPSYYNFEELNEVNEEQQQHIGSEDHEDGQTDQAVDDELADSGDDLSRSSSMRIGSRRKLKMVIDAEDDE